MQNSKTAIYDDETFFKNYIDLRNSQNNYNDLIEQPIILELLGDVKEKRVMDIGCGYGSMAIKIANRGARKVLGIDPSKKMIDKGINENSHKNIVYKVMPAEQLLSVNEQFDIIVSCLAIHYIENIEQLFNNISNLLYVKGEFIFSMEHPIYTASKYPQQWITDSDDIIVTGFITDHYGEEGVRKINWLGKYITKYHHKTDSILNALINAGFIIQQVIEPSPSKELINKVPKTIHELHRPAYLIIKCRKG